MIFGVLLLTQILELQHAKDAKMSDLSLVTGYYDAT